MSKQIADLSYEDAQKQIDQQVDQSLGLMKDIDTNMSNITKSQSNNTKVITQK